VDDIAQLYFSGIHSKKILLQNTPPLAVPLTPALGRTNEASFSVMLICCYYEMRRSARRILGRQLKAYYCVVKQETGLLFMRYIDS